MADLVERIEESITRKAYGRGDHLPAQKPVGILSVERLTEVEWALSKIRDAERALDKLLEGEPVVQPPGARRVEMGKIEDELGHLHERLEQLFS